MFGRPTVATGDVVRGAATGRWMLVTRAASERWRDEQEKRMFRELHSESGQKGRAYTKVEKHTSNETLRWWWRKKIKTWWCWWGALVGEIKGKIFDALHLEPWAARRLLTHELTGLFSPLCSNVAGLWSPLLSSLQNHLQHLPVSADRWWNTRQQGW